MAKSGMSDSMQARIRQLGVQRKAEGGGVELPPGMDVSDLPSGAAAMPGYVPQTEPMPYAPPPAGGVPAQVVQAEDPELAMQRGTLPPPAEGVPVGFRRQGTPAPAGTPKPQEAQPVPPPGAGAPAGMNIPKVGVRNIASVPVPVEDAAAFADVQAKQRGAAEAAAEIGRMQGAAQAGAAIGEQEVMQRHALQQAEIHAKAAEATKAWMDKSKAINDEIINKDMSVDPGRFWASRSTAGKVSAIIGLALGALGAGNDGVNRAALLLNQAIDRDIDAQKAEHEIALRKGAQQLEQARVGFQPSGRLAEDTFELSSEFEHRCLACPVPARFRRSRRGLSKRDAAPGVSAEPFAGTGSKSRGLSRRGREQRPFAPNSAKGFAHE